MEECFLAHLASLVNNKLFGKATENNSALAEKFRLTHALNQMEKAYSTIL